MKNEKVTSDLEKKKKKSNRKLGIDFHGPSSLVIVKAVESS